MNNLLDKIHQQNATAFTHSGKFHADDVFSSALLLYLNPEITITRGSRVPEDFDGIVFDIGRADTIITRRTAEFVRTALPMPHLGFSGRAWCRNTGEDWR